MLIRKVRPSLYSRPPRLTAHFPFIVLQVFVQQQRWLDDTTFNDLLALGNALPGPAFSQVSSLFPSALATRDDTDRNHLS